MIVFLINTSSSIKSLLYLTIPTTEQVGLPFLSFFIILKHPHFHEKSILVKKLKKQA